MLMKASLFTHLFAVHRQQPIRECCGRHNSYKQAGAAESLKPREDITDQLVVWCTGSMCQPAVSDTWTSGQLRTCQSQPLMYA